MPKPNRKPKLVVKYVALYADDIAALEKRAAERRTSFALEVRHAVHRDVAVERGVIGRTIE